jgi:hypothetical protein
MYSRLYSYRALATAAALSGLTVLWGCSSGPNFVAKYEPWRETEERACLVSGYVRETPFLIGKSALGGPSVCGAMRPFEMRAAAQGRVGLQPPALLRCNMIPQLERWVTGVVEPAALRFYGAPLVELKVAASYGCRPMNNISGATLSEHGHANAIDISTFVLADGRQVTVRDGWRGDMRDSDFLHSAFGGACGIFSTVLGPDHDRFHTDHFHLDLMRRGRSGEDVYCK